MVWEEGGERNASVFSGWAGAAPERDGSDLGGGVLSAAIWSVTWGRSGGRAEGFKRVLHREDPQGQQWAADARNPLACELSSIPAGDFGAGVIVPTQDGIGCPGPRMKEKD